MGCNLNGTGRAHPGAAPGMKRANGYALSELLLAVAVFAALAASAGSGYMYMKRTALAEDHALKLVNLVNETRRAYRPLASFSTITGSGLYKMGLVQKPMYSDGTNVYDAWANQMSFAGADTYFAFVLGGNGAMTAQECTAIATGIQDGAYEVRVGASAALATGASVGRTSGGNAYKTAGGTFDGAALQTGCSEANTKIAVSFDG